MSRRRTGPLMTLSFAVVLTVAGCGGGGGSSASTDKFCDAAEDAKASGDDLNAALDEGDPKQIKKVMKAALADYEAAAKLAPKKIRDDIAVVREAQETMFTIFEDNDFDIEAAQEDKEFAKLVSDKKLERANDRLSEFLSDECGIDTSEGSSGDTVEDTSAPMTTEPDIPPTSDRERETTTTEEATTQAAPVELAAEVGGQTVGDASSPVVVYAAVLKNTTSAPANDITVSFTMLDAAGTVVGTAREYIDLLLPGEARAVTGSTSVTAPAANIQATYSGDSGLPWGLEASSIPSGQFTLSNDQLTSDDWSTGVLGMLNSTYPVGFDNLKVDVVFRDAAGSIIGGGYDYVTIPANGQVGINPSTYYAIPGVASYEVYAGFDSYDLD